MSGSTTGADFAAPEHLRQTYVEAIRSSAPLRRFVNIYVDGEDIRFGELLDTPISDGAELQVVPAVAGG